MSCSTTSVPAPGGRRGRQQLLRRCPIESVEPQLGDSGRSEGSAFGLPHAEEHRDAVFIEAAGDERHRGGRGLIEPLGIVDHTQQRLLLGYRREQTQRAAEDGEALSDGVPIECKRRAEGGRLRVGELVDR